MDARGRLADQLILVALGWGPGERLEIRPRHDLLIVRARPDGVFSITNQGHLRLPAPVRRWIGLAAGQRVFLAADPSARRLIVHSPAALDHTVTHFPRPPVRGRSH
jgi:bifunctional DNA-binding transcriptional regulator/antitoxin component of YhaV-PrlF toxin-antitoxin module